MLVGQDGLEERERVSVYERAHTRLSVCVSACAHVFSEVRIYLGTVGIINKSNVHKKVSRYL